jgi:hypothetical protein
MLERVMPSRATLTRYPGARVTTRLKTMLLTAISLAVPAAASPTDRGRIMRAATTRARPQPHPEGRSERPR